MSIPSSETKEVFFTFSSTWTSWMRWGTLRALKVETRAIHSEEQTLSPFGLRLGFQPLGQPLLSA